MRLPRVQFTVWRMMAAAAVLAMIAAAGRAWHLRSYYRQRAAMHAQMERNTRAILLAASALSPRAGTFELTHLLPASEREQRAVMAEEAQIRLPRQPQFIPSKRDLDRAIEEVREAEESFKHRLLQVELQTAYHAAMRKKYEYAARHPWESVTPNAPPP